MTDVAHTPVSAKIRRPRAAPNAIERPGPTHLLDRVPDHRITLVTGPAGFGKSWLVSDWLDWHPDWHHSWITIDLYDSDAVRLWTHVIESIRQSSAPHTADAAGGLLTAGRSSLPLIIDTLTADLALRDDPSVIVFDDIHRLAGGESTASVSQFLAQLPDNTHAVLVGRHDPTLPLAKWRLAHDLLEIRTADLRCTLDETHHLITESLGLELVPDVVESLHAKTMGWIAGLRMAAMTIARSGDMGSAAGQVPGVATLDGAYDALGDYLVEEVLADLDASTRQFVLDTSVLHDLTPAICDAVSGRTDSSEMLEKLVRSGLFTSRLGESDALYRYHDLFRDALQALLHRTEPLHETEMHRRAATWLHGAGNAIAAVRHALKAGDSDLAGQWLVEFSRPLLMSKQNATLRTLFEQVDAVSPQLRPAVAVSWLFPALFSDVDGVEVDRLLNVARNALTSMTEQEAANDAHLWGLVPYPFHEDPAELIRGIDATIAHRTGDLDLALAALAAQQPEPSESGWVEGAAGEMLLYHEQYSDGLELLGRWHEYAFSPHNPIVGNQAYALAMQAHAKHGTGDLAAAEALGTRAIDLMRDGGFVDDPQSAVAAVPLAWAAWERGDIRTAHDHITTAVDRLDRLGEVPPSVLGRVVLARALASRGKRKRAARVLDRAGLTSAGPAVAGQFADRVALEKARLALLVDDVAGAAVAIPNWRERLARGATTMTEHLVLARMAITAGDDAAGLLTGPDENLEVETAHRLELHKLRAHLAVREGDDDTALDELIAAMRIAAHTGHIQTFLDDAPVFGALLQNAAAASGHRLSTASSSGGTTPQRVPTAMPVEPLTERELEALQLLPSHLTYKGMAEALFVSPNTIKAYVKGIYRKLGAEKRSEAVDNARAMGLID